MSIRVVHYSDIENATDDPQRIGRLARSLRELRNESTLLCGTGDTTAPGLLAMETDGQHAMPFFEDVSPDFSTIGNHDFDHGLASLRTIIEESPQTWLVANLFDGDRLFAEEYGVRPTAVTTVETDEGTERVGLVGVTDPETLSDHTHTESMTVTDPVTAVAEAVTDELDQCEFVVVLSHAGSRDDEIARLDGVDLVLGGHVHDRRAETVDGTPVVHPGECGERISESSLGEGPPTARLHDVTEFPVATDMRERYDSLFSDLGLDETLTHVDSPVGRRRADRYPESAIGNFVADAVRWAAGADVAICHPLLLRSGSPLDDHVSLGEVRATTPFDNDLHSTTLDGSALRALFESIGDPDFLDVGLEVFGHVSGASLSWERTGETVDLVAATVNREPPAATESFTVAAPSFEFYSDLYPVLDEDLIEAEHGSLQDALVEYAREEGITPTTDGRMTAVNDTADGEFWSLR